MKYVDVNGQGVLWCVNDDNESTLIHRISRLLEFQPTSTFTELIPKPHLSGDDATYDWYEFTFQGPLTLAYVDYQEVFGVLSIDAAEKIRLVTYEENEEYAFYECQNQFIQVLDTEDNVVVTYYLEQECSWVQLEDMDTVTDRVNKILSDNGISTENVKLIYTT